MVNFYCRQDTAQPTKQSAPTVIPTSEARAICFYSIIRLRKVEHIGHISGHLFSHPIFLGPFLSNLSPRCQILLHGAQVKKCQKQFRDRKLVLPHAFQWFTCRSEITSQKGTCAPESLPPPLAIPDTQVPRLKLALKLELKPFLCFEA